MAILNKKKKKDKINSALVPCRLSQIKKAKVYEKKNIF